MSSDVLFVVASALGLVASIVTIHYVLPIRWQARVTTAIVLAVLALTIVWITLRLSEDDAYRAHAAPVLVMLVGILAVSCVGWACSTRRYLRLKRHWREKFVHREYFGAEEHPLRLSIDGRRHAGLLYFHGRCVLLPAGTYRISADSSNLGGWSAWERDDDPHLGALNGAWTWNLLLSIPGQTDDFADHQYKQNESFQRALQLGRWDDAWVFASRAAITMESLRRRQFITSIEVVLPTTRPMWFWIWDHSTFGVQAAI